MCVYIGIEDLAANALIEIMTNNANNRFVSYKELEDYGAEVVKFLNLKGEKAILTSQEKVLTICLEIILIYLKKLLAVIRLALDLNHKLRLTI